MSKAAASPTGSGRRLTASLVVYESSPAVFELAVNSFLKATDDGIIAIVDNSRQPLESSQFSHPRVKYIFNNANAGFGKGHNIGFASVQSVSDFHLILNPDVRFESDVLSRLTEIMFNDGTVSAVMPQIRYPDGELQRLCKLLPTPMDLIFRRFIPFRGLVQKLNRRYELHNLPQDSVAVIPSLSGCCLLVRSRLLAELNGFDERFFMYMEDVDLVRRLGDLGKTVYVPQVHVTHAYAKGSYKNPKLLKYHLNSAIKYFNKWGWVFDSVRKRRNQTILQELKTRRHIGNTQDEATDKEKGRGRTL